MDDLSCARQQTHNNDLEPDLMRVHVTGLASSHKCVLVLAHSDRETFNQLLTS